MASSLSFYVSEENVELNLNKDASLDIVYDLTFITTSGFQHGIFFNIPSDDTEVISVENENGEAIDYAFMDVDLLKIYLPETKSKGETTTLIVKLKTPEMVFEKGGLAALRFIPTWFDQDIKQMEFKLYLPGLTNDFTESPPSPNHYTEDGRTVISWQFKDIEANEKLEFLVTFPRDMVDEIYPEREFRKTSSLREQDYSWLILPILFVIIVGLFFWYKIK
jgi:hypothetical protein